MVSKRVYVEHLKHVSLLSECSRKDLEKIALHSDVVDLPAGRVVMHQGMPGSDAFVVLAGTVTVRRNGRKVADLGPGSVVGELALLDQGDRTATVECASACQLLVLTRGEFLAAIEEIPALGRKVFASLAGRLRNLDGRSYV